MTSLLAAWRLAAWPKRLRGMFNLNDPRWGRGDEPGGDQGAAPKPSPESDAPTPAPAPPPAPSAGRRPQGAGNQGPPDLDELWRDFNRKLGGLFGGKGNGRGPSMPSVGPPDMKNAGIGLGLVAVIAVLIWFGTGIFQVNEGQQAVITQFGKYHSTQGAGFNYRLPYPIQRHELVLVTQIRSVDVGRDNVIKATGLRESAMLTQDENIVEIKFAVQFRLSDARAFLFESRDPTQAVVLAAETAVREVVGKMRMDSALSEERDQIAPKVRDLIQSILDRYKVGVEVVGVNLQQGGVRPPEQVQAAFDDVLKAGQERERAKNEAQAYANDVVPRAVGAASRLKEEAEGYKGRIVAQAQGDAQRFRSVLAEYQKAPQVTRDRMYLDSMQQIFSNVTKVLVDSRQGSNLMVLPMDKLLQLSASALTDAPALAAPPALPSAPPAAPTDPRTRDAGRTRDREQR